MRRTWILLSALLLAGCVDESASYTAGGDDHALTVRAFQEYAWDEQLNVTLIASRWPDCQRQIPLAPMPLSEFNIELYGRGDKVFTLRSGARQWQVETQTCSRLADPAKGEEPGERLGTYKLVDNKMVFEAAADKPTDPAVAPR